MNRTFLLGLLLTIGFAYADQGSFTNSRGSTDGTSTINAVFTSGSYAESSLFPGTARIPSEGYVRGLSLE